MPSPAVRPRTRRHTHGNASRVSQVGVQRLVEIQQRAGVGHAQRLRGAIGDEAMP
jgi:hypothetical protein